MASSPVRILARVLAVVALVVLLSFGALLRASEVPDPSPGFGFSPGAASEWMSARDTKRELEAAARTRASWLRVLIDWNHVEPVKGRFDWGYVDRWIGQGLNHNLKILGVIAYTPDWARPPGTRYTAPPADPEDYASFAAAAVARYGHRVADWEIWNEPNLPVFFGYTEDAPQRYTGLLVAAYRAIKAAQPNSTVIAAGLSRGVGDESPSGFLERMYAAGAGGFFDAAATHPYLFASDWLGPDNTDGWVEVGRVHDVMVANGDADKKIWLTEIGAPTSDAASGGVSQQEQARQITGVLSAAAANYFCGPAFIYSIRDIDTSSRSDREDNFGALLTSDWKPKLAATVLARRED